MPERSAAAEPLRAGLDLLGDQWTLLIVQSVFLRVRRYQELRLRLGISPGALAGRLRELLDAGVLAQAPYRDGSRTRQEYRLTERGLELWSLLVSIWAWERDWVPSRARTLPELVHLDCGAATSTVLGCGSCQRPSDLARVHATGNLRAEGGGSRRFRRRSADQQPVDPLMFFPETMRLLGDRWSTHILLAGFLGARHFSDFVRELGIGPSVLSERLHGLLGADVLTAGAASTKVDACAYRLTAKGTAFLPTLALLAHWSDRLGPGAGAEVVFRHEECDEPLLPRLHCAACGKALTRRAVRFTGAGTDHTA